MSMSELTEEQIAAIRAQSSGWPDVAKLLAEVDRLRERRDKAIKRLVRYKADTFLSEQIIAILQGTEAEWYAKYDIKPSGDPS